MITNFNFEMERYYRIDKEKILNDIKDSYENKIKYDSEIAILQKELKNLQLNLARLQKTGTMLQQKLEIINTNTVCPQKLIKKNMLADRLDEFNSMIFEHEKIPQQGTEDKDSIPTARRFVSLLSRISTGHISHQTNKNKFLLSKLYTLQLLKNLDYFLRAIIQTSNKLASSKLAEPKTYKSQAISQESKPIKLDFNPEYNFNTNLVDINSIKPHIKPYRKIKQHLNFTYIPENHLNKAVNLLSVYRNENKLLFLQKLNHKRTLQRSNKRKIEINRRIFIKKSKEELGKLNIFINKYRLMKFRMEIKTLLGLNECMANVRSIYY